MSPDTSDRTPDSLEGRGTPGRSPEIDSFEHEYPGASWLATRVARQLEVIGAQIDALVAGVARRHGVSHAAVNALAIVEAACGPISSGEISGKMHITTGTMSSVLNTLERQGHIERHIDTRDRRRIMVDITPSAQDLLDRLLPEVVQVISVVMEGFKEDTLQSLLDLLAALQGAIADLPEDLPSAPSRRTPQEYRRTTN